MNAEKVWLDNGYIFLQLEDGEMGSLPIKAFPRLYNATQEQQQGYTVSSFGLHWEELDEDLSFDGFFFSKEPESEITRLFKTLPEININQFARLMGVNQSLMAKYVCGIKRPSLQREAEIKKALRRLGSELLTIK